MCLQNRKDGVSGQAGREENAKPPSLALFAIGFSNPFPLQSLSCLAGDPCLRVGKTRLVVDSIDVMHGSVRGYEQTVWEWMAKEIDSAKQLQHMQAVPKAVYIRRMRYNPVSQPYNPITSSQINCLPPSLRSDLPHYSMLYCHDAIHYSPCRLASPSTFAASLLCSFTPSLLRSFPPSFLPSFPSSFLPSFPPSLLFAIGFPNPFPLQSLSCLAGDPCLSCSPAQLGCCRVPPW